MKVTDKKELDTAPLHDILFELDLINSMEDCKEELYVSVYQSLPLEVTNIAMRWGTNDSVFKDSAYEYIEKNINTFRGIVESNL